MNRDLCIQITLTFAVAFMLVSCKPSDESPKAALGMSGLDSEEQAGACREKPSSHGMIESVADLQVELEAVAHGNSESRLFESALLHSQRLDESAKKWNGASANLASRFTQLAPSGNPKDEFFEDFGLAGRESNKRPRVEVIVLVRTVGSLSASRPDLLQALLAKKSTDADQNESDLVVYASALESVMENSGGFRRTGYGGIASLRTSENPIYRLLAAKLMPILELNVHSLAEFYQPYVAEKDETILLAAVDGLTTSGTPKAIEMLRTIASNNRDRFPQIAKSVERALELVASRQRD